MKSLFSFLRAFGFGLLIAVVLVLTGCAALENSPTTARIAVSYATLKVIEKGSTTDEQHARAEKIRKIASDAKTFLAGEGVTLGLLETAVRDQLKPLQLSPADAFLADALVSAVIAELQARVGTGVLSQYQLVTVNEVLGWVLSATGG